MSRKLPYFKQARDPQVMNKILSGGLPEWSDEEKGGVDPTAESEAPPVLRDLCKKCWSQFPDDRPTMRAICTLLSPIASKLLDTDPTGNTSGYFLLKFTL